MEPTTIRKDQGLDRTEITIYCSIVILALALTSFNFFTSDLKISIGVIFLSVFLLLIPDFPLIPVTVVCAVGIVVVRSATAIDPVDFVAHSLSRYLPETVFYLIYGLLLSLAHRFFGKKMTSFAYLVVILAVIDYLSNFCELFIRMQGGALTESYQLGILAVAVARSIVAWFVIFLFQKFKATILEVDHSESRTRLSTIHAELLEESSQLDTVSSELKELKNKADALQASIRQEASAEELLSLADSLSEQIDQTCRSHQEAVNQLSAALKEERADS